MGETIVYFIRHAESVYADGEERTRGISDKGRADAERVKALLLPEEIDFLYSSPYERAVQTIKPLADALGKTIVLDEELRERKLAGADFIIGDRFVEAKQKVYEDFNYSFLGGESSGQAQKRAVAVLMRILNSHEGARLAIGTHGDIMTLMLNAFDARYDFDFWRSTSMPDVYKLTFGNEKRVDVRRLWA